MKFLRKFFLSRKRKDILHEFAEILQEVPKVNTVKGCYKGYKRIAEFNAKLDNKNDGLRQICGKLIEYLMDTKEHLNKGYHKSAQNGWKVKREFPDVNDYLGMLEGKVNLKRF